MILTAQHILQGLSGLPEDRFVNTFHFDTEVHGAPGPTFAIAAATIRDRLRDFFDLTITPGGNAIYSFMPRLFEEVVTVKVYNLADPEPREPITSTYIPNNITLGTSLPNEVACCASFYSGVNSPRTRGRVYIGPLKASAATAVQGEPSIPSAGLQATVAAAAARLASFDTNPGWVTLSKAIPNVLATGLVTNGWVDNAWDTQRRRGNDATARTVWAAT